MKYKGVIFDFNGTLIFDSKYHIQAWQRLISELRGSELSDQEISDKVFGLPNVVALENVFPNQYSSSEKERYSKLKEAYYRDLCKDGHLQLVEGAIALFKELKSKDIPFIIASASIKENIDFFVEQFGLYKWFDVDNIVYDDGSYQNKEAMFIAALRILKVEAVDCLIFEDSKSGVENAISAGFNKIVVIHEQEYNQNFDKYIEVIGHAKDYMNFIG